MARVFLFKNGSLLELLKTKCISAHVGMPIRINLTLVTKPKSACLLFVDVEHDITRFVSVTSYKCTSTIMRKFRKNSLVHLKVGYCSYAWTMFRYGYTWHVFL